MGKGFDNIPTPFSIACSVGKKASFLSASLFYILFLPPPFEILLKLFRLMREEARGRKGHLSILLFLSGWILPPPKVADDRVTNKGGVDDLRLLSLEETPPPMLCKRRGETSNRLQEGSSNSLVMAWWQDDEGRRDAICALTLGKEEEEEEPS